MPRGLAAEQVIVSAIPPVGRMAGRNAPGCGDFYRWDYPAFLVDVVVGAAPKTLRY
jgi:hypothetical protein